MQSVSPPNSLRGSPSRRGRSPRTPAQGSASRSSGALLTEFSNKQPATLTSCLSIPVEGAVPIVSQEELPSPSHPGKSQQTTSNSTKRAPRKSKTHALAALQNHVSSLDNDDAVPQESTGDFFGDVTPISVSPTLDLTSVKTSSPRTQPARSKPRPFGLEDSPVFYPTSDEFKDPMAYIRTISEKAKNYGICKIIPPVGWNMPFVTDSEVCIFFPRVIVIFSF